MVGMCIDGSIGALIGGSGAACLVVDDKGVGAYETLGGGVFFGAGGAIGMGTVVSNGDLEDQAGWFTSVGVSAEALAGGYVNYAVSDDGEVYNADGGWAVGVGVDFTIQRTYTWVQRF
jgi:hypothetical protein